MIICINISRHIIRNIDSATAAQFPSNLTPRRSRRVDRRVVAQFAKRERAVAVEQSSSLLHREPSTEAHLEAPHTFHAADPRGQLRAKEPCIGGFIGDAPDGGEAQ